MCATLLPKFMAHLVLHVHISHTTRWQHISTHPLSQLPPYYPYITSNQNFVQLFQSFISNFYKSYLTTPSFWYRPPTVKWLKGVWSSMHWLSKVVYYFRFLFITILLCLLFLHVPLISFLNLFYLWLFSKLFAKNNHHHIRLSNP